MSVLIYRPFDLSMLIFWGIFDNILVSFSYENSLMLHIVAFQVIMNENGLSRVIFVNLG